MIRPHIIIIGGGIVGLATAYNLSFRFPELQITVIEKEVNLASHQSGRNSGVLHSGIYYEPGSLKARNCQAGKILMERFCDEQAIPFQLCGKVIVATRNEERQVLHDIYARGQANGVNCELIDRSRLQEIEPHTAGIEAIYIPQSGIVDYKRVCLRMAEILVEKGHKIITGSRITGVFEEDQEVLATAVNENYSGDYLLNCAGLHSDRVTWMTGMKPQAQIIPFRGEYFKLKPEAEYLCRSLIYPVPNPKLPFLGVHLTRSISGSVKCGPNAVLAFARDGYRLTDLNRTDLWETLRFPGFQRLAGRYWRAGIGEIWRSASKKAFVKALQTLVPAIREDHLVTAPAGIRAQAVRLDGSIMDDFAFQESMRVINVINAPSPAATSSLAIGQEIVERLASRFA